MFVWNLETNEQLVRLEGHDEESEVERDRLHARRQARRDRSLGRRHPRLGRRVGQGIGEDQRAAKASLAFALSPNGKKAVVSVARDTLVSSTTWKRRRNCSNSAGTRTRFKQLPFLLDDARIVTGPVATALCRLWDAATGTEVHKFAAHSGSVRGVSFTADGKTLVSVGYDHVNRVWDLTARRQVAAFEVHDRKFCRSPSRPMERRSFREGGFLHCKMAPLPSPFQDDRETRAAQVVVIVVVTASAVRNR